MKKPTLHDVAAKAGVSYATADRVLNKRARVSTKSVEKVRAAVAALGYVRNVEAANLSRQKTYRFVFIIPAGANAFFQHVREIINRKVEAASLSSVSIEIHDVPAFDAKRLAEHLGELAKSDLDGLAVVGLEGDALLAPLLALKKSRIPVVSLVSALPSLEESTYIGIDNVMAGRTAGRLVGMAHGGRQGCVQVIVGALNARDHNERLAGFQEVLNEDFPDVSICPVIHGQDNAEIVEAEIQTALTNNTDISAVYNVGAGNRGLARALGTCAKRPFCVAHELVDHSRAALLDRTFDIVIDQRPEEEVSAALNLLRLLADGRPVPPRDPILPTIYVRDNLPPVKTK